jgi:methionine biosynthesis protein MetW
MPQDEKTRRVDINIIFDLIPQGCRVLDLGCGDGELLFRLIKDKKVSGTGAEISEENIVSCVEKGLDVVQTDINLGLQDFGDNTFDYVFLNQTLQAVHKPDLLISEILRVGKKCVVGFPNFGYWRIRGQLLLGGRAPKTEMLPFYWYNTPNIRVLTLKDFQNFCKHNNIRILKQICLVSSDGKTVSFMPNLFAEICVFVIEKKSET